MAHALPYDQVNLVSIRLQKFLSSIGYHGLGGDRNRVGMNPGFGGMSGLGELGRDNLIVSYEYGQVVRCTQRIFTDLPLAPVTKPIDAGIFRFCHTCKKCAEICPAGALDLNDEPNYEVLGPWNFPGAKRYQYYGPKCYAYWPEVGGICGYCQSVCVFSKKDFAHVHDSVKAIVAKTPILNGFFVNMDELFGYGLKNAEEWWDLDMQRFGYWNHPSGRT
ncbi:3-chloro-4-hydroxyphenylacetate reductive dehalogenase [subsurface metagenome]